MEKVRREINEISVKMSKSIVSQIYSTEIDDYDDIVERQLSRSIEQPENGTGFSLDLGIPDAAVLISLLPIVEQTLQHLLQHIAERAVDSTADKVTDKLMSWLASGVRPVLKQDIKKDDLLSATNDAVQFASRKGLPQDACNELKSILLSRFGTDL